MKFTTKEETPRQSMRTRMSRKGAIFHFQVFTPTVARVKLITFERENNG